ncbi:SIMPL domain-containing protein [Leucobacter sp. gxy201]|uniref:SIMPL domain-containing protein n=1 Tax=Leucobacter sp. gxy201 TaxID=2957200 RepID=UPI003DA12DB8
MTTIHATGTGEAHLLAERATITVNISVASRDRRKSIEIATRNHNWAVQRAQELRANGDATWHAADPISTWSYKTYAEGKNNQTVIEHRTASRVRVKLSNLSLVGALVTEFAEAGLTASVDWTLTEATRRESERSMCKAAVAAARAIADDYADALGQRIESVTSISDTAAGQPGAGPMLARASGSAGAAEVTIPEITVFSTVNGVYEAA